MLQFEAKTAASLDLILRQMTYNMSTPGILRLHPMFFRMRYRASLACYGPSLADTWQLMKDQFVISVSGAHDYLVERGITPNVHIECDPRAHKAKFLQKPGKLTTYLIASCCHPDTFKALQGYRVRMWHRNEAPGSEEYRALVSSSQQDDQSLLVGGGTTAGSRAINIMMRLGVKRLDIHGMDCSYRNGSEWAGNHYGLRHEALFRNKIAGKEFETSTAMYNAMIDVFDMLEYSAHLKCDHVVYGDGMLAWVLRCMADGSVKSAKDLLNAIDRVVVEGEAA